MSDFEKQFEKFANQIKFDDMPSPAHSDRLEKDLLEALASKKTPRPVKIWRIIMRSQITKLAAAAVIIVSVVLGLNVFNGTNAWAKVIRALENVTNVHIVQEYIQGNGEEVIQHFWLRRPDGLREKGFGYEIIDNGKERIYLNTEKKEAQISDSWLKDEPVIKHYMFEELQMFRQNKDNDITISMVAEESNNTALVFEIKYKHTTDSRGNPLEVSGKAWVDSESMLPIRIEAALKGQADPNEAQNGVITFEYKPIEDELFAINIPQEYKMLPRKETGYISGIVLDENGNGVSGALVVIGDKRGYLSEKNLTDDKGNFRIKLSPVEIKRPMFPFMIRAFKENDTFKVAWTILKKPNDNEDYGIHIPGKIGHVIGEYFCNGASDVVLQMEPSGIIFGQVTDEHNNPVGNAKVWITYYRLYEKNGKSFFNIETNNFGEIGEEKTAFAITDDEGNYEITNIPRLYDKTKFCIRSGANDYVMDENTLVTVGPLVKREVNFILFSQTVTIKGIVKDNYGKALDERDTIVSANGKEYPSCRRKTDKDGTFRIENCPAAEKIKITAVLNHNSYPPHLSEKHKSYVFYPPVSIQIDLSKDKKEYDIQLIAQKPEIVIDVEVRNSAGELLPYFPVEIRSPQITTAWQIDKQFEKRTNKSGKCRFEEVPNMDGLVIILHAGNSIFNEKIEVETKKIADEYKKKYFWNEIPIEIIDGQKEYKIQAIALSREEYQKQKESSK